MHTSPMTQSADITSQMPARERWLTTVEHAQRAARFGLAIEISGDARPVSLAERLDRLVPAGYEIELNTDPLVIDITPDLSGIELAAERLGIELLPWQRKWADRLAARPVSP